MAERQGDTRRQLLTKTGGLVVAGVSAKAFSACGFDGDLTPVPANYALAGSTADLSVDRYEARVVPLLPEAPAGARDFDVYLRLRDDSSDEVVALLARCTHLGCPVRYVRAAEIFSCPCHGGVFDFEGNVIGGPPKESLEQLDALVIDSQVYLPLRL